MNSLLKVFVSVSLGISMSACFSNGSKTQSKISGEGQSLMTIGNISTDPSSTTPLSISTVDVPVKSDASTARPVFKITLKGGMRGYCPQMTSCKCRYTWRKPGESSEHSKNIAAVDPFNANTGYLYCAAPEDWNQLPAGTSGTVAIVQISSNSVISDKYAFTLKPINIPANFLDSALVPFSNIRRYTCYEKNEHPVTIIPALGTYNVESIGTGASAVAGGPRSVPLATQFCYRKKTINSTTGMADNLLAQGCSHVDDGNVKSVQSFYYSLYIRNDKLGAIVQDNGRYHCSKVMPGQSLDSTSNFWPLDSTFALRQEPSADFNVGVASNSVLGGSGGAMEACFGRSTAIPAGAAASSMILTRCLGYAKKPEPNGTCNPIQIVDPACTASDKSACTRLSVPTYRLRKYLAVYPQSYNPNGRVIVEPRGADIVFAIDRPYGPSANNVQGTIQGPKPCPFAYFDSKTVITGQDSCLNGAAVKKWYSTNDVCWKGKNPDGTMFPNVDDKGSTTSPPQCAALLPIVRRDANGKIQGIHYATTHMNNNTTVDADGFQFNLKQVYIRPSRPWAPHYEEDLNFQACAPMSGPNANQFVDPPLHLAKSVVSATTTTPQRTVVSWCAAVYPTTISGKGSTRPNSVSAIDRTVDSSSDVSHWSGMPLQAPQAEVDKMLQSDPSYACTVTSTKNAAVAGTFLPTQPDVESRISRSLSSGCCKLTGNASLDLVPDSGAAVNLNKGEVRYREAVTQKCEMPNGSPVP